MAPDVPWVGLALSLGVPKACRIKHLYGRFGKKAMGRWHILRQVAQFQKGQSWEEKWWGTQSYGVHSSKILIHALHLSLFPAASQAKPPAPFEPPPQWPKYRAAHETGFFFSHICCKQKWQKQAIFFLIKQNKTQPKSRYQHYFQRHWLKILVQRAEKEWYM